MRILFFNPYYKPYLGGIERIIDRLGTEFSRHPEVEAVGVLTTRVYHPEQRIWEHLPKHEVVGGIQVYRCTFRPATIPRLFNVDNVAGYLSREVPAVLRRFRPSILHIANIYWWPANLQAYLCTLQTPHILMTAYHPVMRARRTRPYAWANRWLARRADALHVFSEMERQQVHQAFGAPLDRTRIIPPGVDLPAQTVERGGDGPVTIIAVGRLQPGKGQLRLVAMVHQLLEEVHPYPVRLWLVGADSGSGTAIDEYVARHGLGDVVTTFGFCSDEQLAELYRQADIFALPTRYESFGIVFIEAMAHGLPVVTYGVGPVPTVLTRGARVLAPDDERSFSAALKDLILRPTERLQLGEAGRRLVAERYSWQVAAQSLLDLYRQVAR